MLARLEAHIGEQQRFAANASHELRTPLAITQTLLDVARHGIPDFRDPEPGSDGGMVIHLGSNVNPNSPQFQKAQQTCQNKTHGGKG